MKLTRRNYFSRSAGRTFMSVSQFKAFSRCQAAALAEIRGKHRREKSTAMLVGSYVDAHFDGTMEAFRQENPEIFKRDGSLKSEFVQAEAVIRRMERDRLFMKYISGQKQVIMTGSIAGVDVKIMMDSYAPGVRITDRKVMRDFADVYLPDRGRVPWFEAWGYDMQGAVYQEIVRQNTGKRLPFFLAAATKEQVPDIELVEICQETLDICLEEFARNVPLYDAVKKGIVKPERCGCCNYCRETKVLRQPVRSDAYGL